jgi:uncharacterized protein (TIGR04222 family)
LFSVAMLAIVWAVVTAVGGQATVATGPAPLRGAGYVEEITKYDVDLVLKPDGSMHVKETIGYDFGSWRRHGITRDIPVEFTYDEKRVREYPISNIKVSSPSGAPADLAEDIGSTASLRIGDPDETVSGAQTYVIQYDLEGVVNSFDDHQELYWNAIGSEWDVSIRTASAKVEGPAGVQKVACFKGVQGSTDTCTGTVGSDGTATFAAAGLQPRQGMTVVTSFPAGTFPNAAPVIKERQTLARAFSLTPVTGAGSIALLGLLGGGAFAMVSRRGRDERYLGVTPGLEPGFQQEHSVSRVSWLRRDPIAVQFTPPDGMRPGQLGTLIDEHANVVDVTATLVDLAVRGYLKIEEVEEPGMFRSGDWRLIEVTPAPAGDLHDYERKLFNAIFQGRSEVLLSDLKTTFSSDLQKVQEMLYADVTRQGWFRGNPSSVRTRWVVYGILLTLAGAGLTFLLATRTAYGLLGVAVVLSGLLLLILAPQMPARTAKGTALLAQAKGFRLYLEKAEANQIRFEEGEDIFSRYLPYAIVFGVAERWAKVFAALAASGVAVAVPSWYVGSMYGHGLFNYAAFGSSMDSFSTVASGSIAAATPSSSGSSGFSGGFSGGGGGGGGGGSW